MKQVLIGALAMGAMTIGSLTKVDSAEAASLGGYDFGASPGTLTPTIISPPGVTFSNFSYVGTGVTRFESGVTRRAYAANNFSNDDIIDINDSDSDGYFTFNLTPDSNKLVSLSEFQFSTRANGAAAPQNVLVKYSLDNFASNLFSTAIQKNSWQDWSFSLSDSFTQTVSFRIYGFNTGLGVADNLRIDDVLLSGSVADIPTPVPTPALLPGLVGLGLTALRRRKQAQDV